MKLINLRYLTMFWKTIIVILVPIILFIPLVAIINTKESRCGYIIVLMAIFWMTEVVPMAVTALMPVFGFPLLGVTTTEDICYVYMKETNMMFISGLIVAIAVEYSNLHKRIALFVILHIGQSPVRLMAGFMITTMFLSMWISNTASTAMMVPIVDAILQEFYRTYGADTTSTTGKEKFKSSDCSTIQMCGNDQEISDVELNIIKFSPQTSIDNYQKTSDVIVKDTSSMTATPPNEKCRAFRDMFFLATAYGANLGGTGSYTGSGTNLVLKGVLRSLFTEVTDLNFASWLLFNVPGMLICGIFTFLWLKFYFLGFGKNSKLETSSPEKRNAIRKIIQDKYNELGSMTFHEIVVLFLFIVLVLLWFFLAPGFIPGWGDIFKRIFGPETSIDDSTPAMFIIFLLFVIPKSPNFLCFRDAEAKEHPSSSGACLTWKVVHERVPWGIVLLMGGGFAMAKGAQDSGLSLWLGEQMKGLSFLPPEVLLLCICLMTAMATEITSNAATASVLLPVLKELSVALCINPLFLMLPATLCCSYAFMLPVATPPNALVFGAANIDSKVMIKAGIVPNIICVLVVTLMINTLGHPIFNIGTMPKWANSSSDGQLVYC